MYIYIAPSGKQTYQCAFIQSFQNDKSSIQKSWIAYCLPWKAEALITRAVEQVTVTSSKAQISTNRNSSNNDRNDTHYTGASFGMSQNILKENIRRGTKQPPECENIRKPASQFKPRGRSMLTPHAVKYWHHSCTVCQVLCWTKTCVKTFFEVGENTKLKGVTRNAVGLAPLLWRTVAKVLPTRSPRSVDVNRAQHSHLHQ